MRKKKIMVLYTTAGMGHKKAAFAIHEAFEGKSDLELKLVDALEHSSRFYRFLYKDLYVFVVSRMRWLWGFMFHLSNTTLVDALTRRLRHWTDRVALRDMISLVRSFEPDAIVSTHFALSSMAGEIKKKYLPEVKLYSLITDYGPHSFWLCDEMDRYFVGAEEVKVQMLRRGVRPSRVTVTGIAVEKVFSEVKDTEKIKEEFQLERDKKIVLLMSGGFGVGPMKDILKVLEECTESIQVIAVCGHNKALFEELSALSGDLSYPVKVIGFTEKVADLMAVSDLMVTKAGGISVTEALAASLPMALFASIPGQEHWNEELLVGRGAALKAHTKKEVAEVTDRALLSEDVHESLKESIEKLRNPHAAQDIADAVREELKDIT